MNLVEAREVVEKIHRAGNGQGALPSNSAIRESVAWLLKFADGNPEIRQRLSDAINAPMLCLHAAFAHDAEALLTSIERAIAADPVMHRKVTYVPNSIPASERQANFVLGFSLLAYGYIGLRIDDVMVPLTKRTLLHLHGIPAWLMVGAMICFAAAVLSVVIDHYDHRDNEHHYLRFSKAARAAAWWLFGAALVVHFLAWINR